jgi:class 3 adenylate cyclase
MKYEILNYFMPKFLNKYISVKKDGKNLRLIPNATFESFKEEILGLGEIDVVSNPINTLSVMFDLEGFTNFCKQIDPQLAVPDYLNRFLKWIFNEIKIELTNKKYDEGVDNWADLPFFAKFLGDGLLFLWDTSNMAEVEIRNAVVSMLDICKKYKTKFFPEISHSIIAPPSKLRCGIARGIVYSVGNGNDYVGPCINVSARLQKLNSLTFCFSRRGVDPAEMGDSYKSQFLIKKVDIRGIGSGELVCILKSEFQSLSKEEKKYFTD